jgi:hypothetical protein
MSTSPALPQVDEAEVGESTLFDSLARLVPPELQKPYYPVLAHTHTLGPHPRAADASYTEGHCG